MSINRAAHLMELSHVFAGTPIASEWAQKAAATRKARSAQLVLPLAQRFASLPAGDLPRRISRCRFIGPDGCCAHPSAVSAECHRWAPCYRLRLAAPISGEVPYGAH